MVAFVGRVRALRRLHEAADAAAASTRFALVSGEAGIGKTTLVGTAISRLGRPTGWGTAADAERTPAFWPWTCALRTLLATAPDPGKLPASDAAEVGRLLPELAGDRAAAADSPGDPVAARLRLFDTVARFLERLADGRPTVIVLDDLQWADSSSLQLLAFLARAYRPAPLLVIGAYRPDELPADGAGTLAEVARHGESIELTGLAAAEVRELVAATCGTTAAERWAAEVHQRSGGHPFFARQLAELLTDETRTVEVPAAVRDVLLGRLRRLGPEARALVDAAAVAGDELQTDVLGEVCGLDQAAVAGLIEEGLRAGVLVRAADGSRSRLAHDLVRETIVDALVASRRPELHRRIADALERRHVRGFAVVPADLARHCAAAVALEGPDRAVRWATTAARAECARLAFAEAAAQLARARRAIEDAGAEQAGGPLVDLLVEEADARARAGDSAAARRLLADATGRAGTLGDGQRLALAALATQRLGARFAMPRAEVVEVLTSARQAVRGSGGRQEAQLTAALARELSHSVPTHRAQAPRLSSEALALARTLDDPATLAACLLARHDVLWTPGRASERTAVAREIVALAERTADVERRAEGLLLTANALLEDGSAAFRPVLDEYLAVTERFGQPRHDYLALTRRGALALIDGRLDEAESLIEEATALGERIGEPDVGNVRMSQLLGLVRARGEPPRLRETAAEAIRWWVGVPSHAHAVAAGLFAEAGELAEAARSLDAVRALGVWRDDRSYLWSVFVGGMATAAVRLADRDACAELLAELEPVTTACGVNGALVCFSGSNAHWAGLLADALGERERARDLLEHALAVHRRLGARVWEAESCAALAALEEPGEHAARAGLLAAQLGLPGVAAQLTDPAADAELRRDGELWLVAYRGSVAHLRDLKGLADLAVLIARPRVDVHVLALVGAGPHDRPSGDLLDAPARAAYRHRLAELDRELAATRPGPDPERARRLERERAALGAEVERAAGLGGRSR
ncbi:MAG TPA: AAA family ATPase, partial [Pseudonocardia sp.]|nr:AAA family ATPase [Pseudonocardia sp.]